MDGWLNRCDGDDALCPRATAYHVLRLIVLVRTPAVVAAARGWCSDGVLPVVLLRQNDKNKANRSDFSSSYHLYPAKYIIDRNSSTHIPGDCYRISVRERVPLLVGTEARL